MTNLFWRAHTDLPREAPGSEATSRLLLQLAGALPPRPAVLDVGCGTGPAAVLLAQLTGGHVTAVDRHEPFLAAVTARAGRAGVHVETLHASMDALPVDHGSVDLLWAEGSAYSIGVDNALATWRPLLTDHGVVVLTEAEWLTTTPAPATRTFWDANYPGMRSMADNVTAFEQAGWSIRATYLLPDSDWDNYYGPLGHRIDQLDATPDEIAELREEIDIRAAHPGDYGYRGYVLAA